MKNKLLSLLLLFALLIGTFTVLNASATVSEDVCPSCGQALDGEQSGVRGDLNGDGVVDIEDIVDVINLASGIYTVTFVDHDGSVLKTERVLSGKSATAPDVPTREGYAFVGWDKDFDRVSKDLTVTALWENLCYTRDGDFIYFGEYPQSIKAESVMITETTDSRGYYLGSDGEYYAKVTANPCNSGYTFSTGATVSSGTVYYFKVEPLRWRMLLESGDTAFILCDSIIANKRFDDSSNNYANSEVRAWLNAEFYTTAFDSLQRELILSTTVDNSVYSTGYNSNSCACANTSDKIFIPSYREITNTAYGFSSSSSTCDTARRIQTSDYARGTGAWMFPSDSNYGNGLWWLRSPNGEEDYYMRGVASDGQILNYYIVYEAYYGVVPALQICLR